MKTTKNGRRVLSLLFAFVMIFGIVLTGVVTVAAEENANVARIGNEEYATLGAAISAATAGDTIELIADASGNVTVNKDVTIDGGDNHYTGTMTLGAVTATIKNVKFVNGEIVKTENPVAGNFTVQNCSFSGNTASGYAIKVGRASSLTVQDCTSEDVSFLYVPYSVVTLNVSGVKIERASWGVHLVSINNSNFEGVDILDSDCGIVVQNTGNKTVNLTDCTIEADMPIVIWEKQTNAVNFNFKGDNLISDTKYQVWAIYNNNYVTDRASAYGNVIVEADATLDVIKASVATVNGEGYKTLKEAIDAANALESATVTLLEDVTLGEKLTVSGNVTVNGAYTITRADNYTGTLFVVSAGATLTLDGGLVIDGGNEYVFDAAMFAADAENWNVSIPKEDSAKWFTPEEGAPVATAFMFTTTGGTLNFNNVTVKNNYSVSSGVVSAGANSTVTFTGATITHVASTQGSGVVANVSDPGITVTVNDGTKIDGNHVGGNHGLFKIYSGATLNMNGGEITNNTGWNSNGVAVGVYWGTFNLNGGRICSNTGVYGPSNGRNAAIYLHSGHTFVMNGGTVCHNSGRSRGGIDAPYDNGTATINGGSVLDNISRSNGSTPDVLGTSSMTINGGIFTQDVSEWLAEGLMLVDLGDGTFGVVEDPRYNMAASINGEYYATFWDAYNAAQPGDTVLLLKTAVIDTASNLRLDKKINLEVAKDLNPALRIQGNGTVHLWNLNIKNEYGYAIIVGDTDGLSSPEVHIHGGIYQGVTSVVSVTSGTFYIDKEGGEFKLLAPYDYGYTYLINCVDANYGTKAKVVIYGGTFYNWNPANNEAEGKGTNFCANGYTPRELSDGVWKVHVYKRTVVAPTYDSQGYTMYECERCDDHYVDEKSYVPALVAVAEVNGVKFGSLKEAIEYCKNGETVKLLSDIVYTDKDIGNSIGGATNFGEYYNPTIISIGGTAGATPKENKPSEVNVIIDLNGHSIINNAPAYLFIIMDNAQVTFRDSVGGGKIDTNVEAPVIWVIGSETLVTIESGYYETDSDMGLLHATHAGDLVIKGGEFKTTADNASLLIMINSTSFKNPNHFLVGVATVSIEGGIFHGFNPSLVGDDKGAKTVEDIKFVNGCAEGYVPEQVGDGIWGVTLAVAELNGVMYPSFWEALEVAKSGDVILLYTTVVITEDRVVDLKGVRVNAASGIVNAPMFRILADVTFFNGIVDARGPVAGEGGINAYAFIVGDANTSGILTITDGTYRGVTSAISITNGVVNISGGTFQVGHDNEGADYGATYLLNCIDSAYANGTAHFNITGGKFVGFNPENNAAEGEGTNFLSDGYKASDYAGDNKWYVCEALLVMDGNKYFATIKDALATLSSADTTVHTIKLVEDIEIDVNYSTYNYPILVNGFKLVLDLNGKTITADWSKYTGTRVDNALIGVVNGGHLTIIDSVGGGKIINNDSKANVENRVFWIMNSTATKQTIVDIQGGIFIQNDTTALLYIQGDSKNSTNLGVLVEINGGHFETVFFDFFNAYDGNSYTAWVLGGTFNKDPRDNEIRIPSHLTSLENPDGTWGIAKAIVTVGNNGYSNLNDAVAAAKDGNVVVLNESITVTEPIVVGVSITIDLGGNTVSGDVYPIIRVQNGAELTVKNGNIENGDYVFVLGASDGSSAGYLTIESGNYMGETTVASVTNGKLTVLGGTFIATDNNYGYRYLLNCIDESYRNGTALIEVKGGSFYGFNPADNKAEGNGTSFLGEGYYTWYDSTTGFYTVAPFVGFHSSNLLLGNTIGMYFNIKTDELANGVNYVAVFNFNGQEYRIPRYDENGNSNWTVRADSREYTRILFSNIAAKEMTLDISVVITLDGKVISDVASDSVKGYVERGIERGIFTAKDMDLVIQMINYGAIAQESFDFNVENLANTGELAAELLDEYTRADGSYENKLDAKGYYGTSLNLEDHIGFNFKFYAEGLENVVKAVVTYVDHTGKAVEIEVDAGDFIDEIKKGKDLFVIRIDTLVAADAMQLLTCEMLDKDGNVLAYANDSIESYCARAIAGLSAMSDEAYAKQSFKIEFYQALMKYSMAAYDYDSNTKREGGDE